MIKQFSLWIEQYGKQLMSRGKSSDFQTLRLFAILAALTMVFVIMLTVVQFSPVTAPRAEIKPTQELKTEAKLAP
jgi:hypothetical protein